MIDESEFDAVSAETDLYESWDADEDEGIGEEELHAGLYDTADENDDEVVSEEEDGWFDWF